jgi:hypothetical protein
MIVARGIAANEFAGKRRPDRSLPQQGVSLHADCPGAGRGL